ncbi:homolog of yeast autophagy 18 (ATG18) D [Striga asiatica]|uniref:Homolog of yeast autophagy 18 (ATG18) D n=1 Tax=Striga asiatica TaxID=4170 RepID=A0A5A7R0K1_STRAF|nr:homolog of yeast autophagy 18 (ATG18) D [Striga asiatica]
MTIESPSGTLCPTEQKFSKNDETELYSVSWNQDYSCFSAGTSQGFRIYNCNPFKETFRRDLKGGKFKTVEMLCKSNVLALVGTKADAQLSPNNVIIWDDHQSRLISRIDTVANPRGLCSLSNDLSACVLACPGLKCGQVRVEHFGLNLKKMISAHDSKIAFLTLTADGLLLATASVRGTLIRISNSMDGTLLQEVRRGLDTADIHSIALSSDVRFLAVSSDKGTDHVFSLRVRMLGENTSADSELIRLSRLFDFSKQWCQSWFIIVFHESFYRCSFDPVNGGDMVQQEHVDFLKTETRHI